MAVPVFQTSGALAYSATTRTTSSIPVPTGVASGDVILVYLYIEDAYPTVTPPTGFTEITFATTPDTGGTNRNGQRVFWKRASAADTGTYAFTHTACITEGVALRFTGVLATGTPYEAQSAALRASAGTTTPAVSITTTGVDRLLVWASTDYNSSSFTAPTQGGTWTERYDAAKDLAVDTLPLATAGTVSNITSTITSGFATASVLALLPAASILTPSFPETVTMTETVATAVAYNRSVTETEALTETVTVARGLNPSVPTETVALTETATAVRGLNRPVPTETVAIGEGVSVQFARAPVFIESAHLTESFSAEYVRADITDYQFVIADNPGALQWVPFGAGQAINVSTFDPGNFDLRTQDENAARGDYRIFGTDYKVPPTWSWQMWTDRFTAGDALAWTEALAGVWDDAVRSTPNGVLPLRYCLAGRIRRVYGRPRRFTAVPDQIQLGKIHITADFALAEDAHYDDTANTLTTQITPATIQGSGIHIPAVVPWRFSNVPVPRTEQIVVGGSKPAWVDVVFNGPVTNPWVQIGSLTWGLSGTVPAGRHMTLSGKSWQMGVFNDLGAYHPEMLDPRARLSSLQLNPGIYPVTYGGSDNSGSSSVTLSWRNAYRAL